METTRVIGGGGVTLDPEVGSGLSGELDVS